MMRNGLFYKLYLWKTFYVNVRFYNVLVITFFSNMRVRKCYLVKNNLVLWTNLIVQVYYLNVVFVTTWCCFKHNCPSLKFQDEMGNLYLQVHGVLLREYLKTCHGTILLRRFRSDYKVLKIKALCYLMSTYCLCFRLNFKSDCHLWFSF